MKLATTPQIIRAEYSDSIIMPDAGSKPEPTAAERQAEIEADRMPADEVRTFLGNIDVRSLSG